MDKDYRDHAKLYGPPPDYDERRGVVYGPPPIDRKVGNSMSEMQEDVYGPPVEQKVKMQPTVYGPPPVPRRKGCMAGLITVIIAAVAAIIFFFTGKKANSTPNVYSSSKDSIENTDSMRPCVYGPPSIDDIEDN